MSLVLPITTGEQSVSATGAVTGTLSTATLPQTGTIHCRVRGLLPGQSVRVALEDTNNSTPFSDALQVAMFDIGSGQNVTEGTEVSKQLYELPDIRWGSANTKLRANVQAITSSTTALVDVFLKQ